MGEAKETTPPQLRKWIKTVAKNKDPVAVRIAFDGLTKHLKPIIERSARRYNVPGIANYDDMKQICLIAIFEACKDYRPRGNIGGFFYRVLDRKCCSQLTHWGTMGRKPPGGYAISMDTSPINEDGDNGGAITAITADQ